MGWSDSRKSETSQPGNEHDQDDSGPDHRTSTWQDLAKLVPPIPQDEVQERKDNEWEKPESHADMIHLRTAEFPKEDRSDEQLDKARETAGDGEGVTDLGGLGVKDESDEHPEIFEIRCLR